MMDKNQYFIQELKTAAHRKGANLEDLFLEYDKNETGRILYAKFRTILSSIAFWCEEDRLRDATYPYVKGHYFFYSEFLKSTSNSRSTNSLSDAELKIFGQFLLNRGTCIIDICRPYDHFRTGRIGALIFIQAAFNHSLAKKIADHYTIPGTADIEYVQIARDVQTALSKNIDLSKPLTPPMEINLPPCFPIVAQIIKEQRIDAYSAFFNYDRRHLGTIPTDQFLGEISKFGVQLSPSEFVELGKAFTDPQCPSCVNYNRFCEEVEKSTPVTFRLSGNPRVFNNGHPSPQQTNLTAEEVMAPFIGISERDIWRLKNFFSFEDHEQIGFLPSHIFFKGTKLINLNPNQKERAVLIEKYQNPSNGSIDYLSFLADLHDPNSSSLKEKNQSEINNLFSDIHSHLLNNDTRLRPILERIDKVGTGMIGVHVIIEQLEISHFRFSLSQKDLIGAHFGERTSIEQFCKLVDPTLDEIEEHKEQQRRAGELKTAMENAKKARAIPDKHIVSILASLCQLEDQTGLDLRTEFHNIDHLHTNFIKFSVFKNLILSYSVNQPEPLSIGKDDIDDLFIFYRVNKSDEMLYQNLLDDKEKYGLQWYEEMLESQQRARMESQIVSERVEWILKKICGFCSLKHMDLLTLLKTFDTTRTGDLPPQKFVHALGMITYFTNEEVEELIRAFANKNGNVNYRRLLEIVEKVNLTKDDLVQIKIDPRYSEVSQRDIEPLLVTIKEKMISRRKRLIDVFASAQSNEISSEQFKQILKSLDLIFKTADVQLLIKKYRANLNGDINWQTFCKDVQSSRSIQY